MKTEFKLSDWIEDTDKIDVSGVKEFIRRLKDRFTNAGDCLWGEEEIKAEIDKLVGERLTK